jgi:hypothetical protein
LWAVNKDNEVWVHQSDPGQFVSDNFAFVYGPMDALLATPERLFFGNRKGFYLETPFGEDASATWADSTLAGGWRTRVRDIQLAPGNEAIWIATNQGVFSHQNLTGDAFLTWMQPWTQISPVTWIYLTGLPTRELTHVLPLPDGQLWIGAQDQGVIYVQLDL